jgi:AhpD family alkylhydroperoxidase
MSHRIQLANQVPAAVSAMMGLESYLGGTDIPLSLKELIKLRASMINGCAYCIEMHADVAMKHGESAQRLLALAAWQSRRCSTPGAGGAGPDRRGDPDRRQGAHDADL